MRLTSRRLNRATLARQLLLERAPISPVEAVSRIVAIQAQEPASPYVALHNRVAAFDPAALDAAFAARAIVKATLMRITLHAVTLADYPVLHEAMQTSLRAARLNDRRFLATGLTAADADALLPEVLAHAAILAVQCRDGGVAGPAGRRDAEARHLVGDAPLRLVPACPVGGPWSFGPRPAYQAAPPVDRPADRAAAVRGLALRYLGAFGPASIADIGQFSMISRMALREALQPVDGQLEHHEGPGGEPLLDVPGGAIPDDETVAPPRLMAMWDSVLLAYVDRSPPHPARVPQLTSSAPMATRSRRCSSTGGSQGCGVPWMAGSRRPPSRPCRTTPGPGST